MDNDSNRKRCGKCRIERSTNEFSKCAPMKDGLQRNCKSCDAESKKMYRDTLKGTLQQLLDSAKRNAKARGKMGRTDAAMVDIDSSYLSNIWEQQEGRCHYTNIPMDVFPGLFQISLERSDQAYGYIKGNVVLCCLACNTKIQWTHEIVKVLIQQHLSHDRSSVVYEAVRNVRKALTKTAEDCIINEEVHSHCTRCDQYKLSSEFSKYRGEGCTACRKKRNEEKRSTLRGMMSTMLGSAKNHNRYRNQNTKRTLLEFDLNLEDLVSLHQAQGGRCAISAVPFENLPGKPFSMSLDRINVNLGYIQGNLRIVAAVLNPIDHSALRNEQEEAGSWTTARYQFAMECAKSKFGDADLQV